MLLFRTVGLSYRVARMFLRLAALKDQLEGRRVLRSSSWRRGRVGEGSEEYGKCDGVRSIVPDKDKREAARRGNRSGKERLRGLRTTSARCQGRQGTNLRIQIMRLLETEERVSKSME